MVEGGSMALKEGGALSVEKEDSIPMVAWGAWMRGASGGRETE